MTAGHHWGIWDIQDGVQDDRQYTAVSEIVLNSYCFSVYMDEIVSYYVWWHLKPVDVKTNNIEFKVADKMADRVEKPTNLRAENGNTVFNNVFCKQLFLSWLRHHSMTYSQNMLFKMTEKMADKVSKSANLMKENAITVFRKLLYLSPWLLIVDPIDHNQRRHSLTGLIG